MKMLFLMCVLQSTTLADFACTNSFGFELTVYASDLFHTVSALTDEMLGGAVHVGTCQTNLTLDNENNYSASFDAKWESCEVEPQMDSDWIFFEAEVVPDPPILVAQRGIVITKSLVKPFTIKCVYPITVTLDTNIEILDKEFTAVENETDGDIDDIFDLAVYVDKTYTELINDEGVVLGDQVYAEVTSEVVPSNINWFISYCKIASDSNLTVSVTMFEDYYCVNDIFSTALESTENPYQFNFMSFWFTSYSTGVQHLICEIHLCVTSDDSCVPDYPTECDSGYSISD